MLGNLWTLACSAMATSSHNIRWGGNRQQKKTDIDVPGQHDLLAVWEEYGNFGISLALLGYSPCFLLDSNRLQVKDVLLSIYVTLPQPRSPQFLTGNFGFGSPHELLRLTTLHIEYCKKFVSEKDPEPISLTYFITLFKTYKRNI